MNHAETTAYISIDSDTYIANMEQEVRVGVIGCGNIANKHLDSYQSISGFDVTVTDIDTEKAREAAAAYDVAWEEDPDTLLRDPDIDAIDVCVPVTAHQEIIETALFEGKDVFSEKPLAQTTEEAMQIRRWADETGNMLMVGYLYRFHPAFELVQEVLSKGIIGDPHYAIFRVGGRGSHRAWKHDGRMGGGAANEMLVHMLDLMIWWFDAPTETERLWTDTVLEQRDIDGETVAASAEDLVVLRARTEGGTDILCESDLVTPSYMNSIEIHGENGSILTSILDHVPTSVYCKEPTGIYDRGHNFHDFSYVDLFEKELSYFKDCITSKNPPELNTLDDAIEVRRIIDATL
jgi:predicted dehydrogenase